jgi:hypothetical protein
MAIFMSSASGLFAILVSGPFIVWHYRNPWYKWMVLPASFFMGSFPYMVINLYNLYRHWQGNVFTKHYHEAFLKFGYIPRIPFGSYLHILWTYSWTFCIIIAVFLFGYFILYRKQWRMQSAFLWIFAYLMTYAILLDLSPFTKLGRAYFNVFPLTIIAAVIVTHQIIKKIKWFVFPTLLLACVIIVQNVIFIKDMAHARKGALNALNDKSIYVLSDDPHSQALKLWSHAREVSSADLVPQGAYLLLGPTGQDSGKSIMRNSALDDYYPKLIGRKYKTKETLPYYAYFPSFLMEEEISEALLFTGKSPDSRLPRLQLTLFGF